MTSTSSHFQNPLLVTQAFIDGQWLSTSSTFEVTNPATSEPLAQVTECTGREAEAAVAAAVRAFPAWSATTAKHRSDLLMRLFALQKTHLNPLAELITAEMGKPLWEAKGELTYGASFLEYFAEEAKRVHGEILQSPWADRRLEYTREPVGVVALITPWNFPNAMIVRKLSAALAAGCTVVVKPAEDTPLSALALAQLVNEAGFPPGVVNVVPTSRAFAPEVGRILCESPAIAVLSFTGSTEVGKMLLRQSAGTVKRLALELGGHAPFIVFPTADVDAAVKGLITAKFRNGGQSCICPNRVYVANDIYDEFVRKLQQRIEAEVVLGNGLDPKTTVGPLINHRAVEKVQNHVRDALSKGARLVLGGNSRPAGSLFVEPGLLVDCNESMLLAREETFGPIIPVFRFGDEPEVVRRANDSRRGLAGYFYSGDYVQIQRVARQLQTGMVVVNEAVFSTCEAPFGGIKESGIGREGSKLGIEEYLNVKYVCLGGLRSKL